MMRSMRLRRWRLWFACLFAPLAPLAHAQDVELYDQPAFAGVRLTLSTNAPDLAAYGLGGRVASVVVKKGQWEFCTLPQFGGACIAVGPGRYAELPTALRGALASLRNTAAVAAPTVVAAAPAAAVVTPVVPAAAVAAASTDAMVLYEHAAFAGRKLGISAATPRLGELNFNDIASSVEVFRGRWQFCVHADYAGECIVLGVGRHAQAGRFNDAISSIRPVYGKDDKPLPPTGGVVLFEHSDFKGVELLLTAVTPNLVALNFNDKASSIEVLAGRWELCLDADFKGRCISMTPGRYNLEKALNDRISSVRPQ